MTMVASERHAVTRSVGGREVRFETGHLAKQADGAVVVRSGETMVLATAQGRAEAREGADFFPLTVDVEERMYAAGKIPGGFFKRESTVAMTWTSFLNPFGHNGRIGRSTMRAVRIARSVGLPSRLKKPPGIFPAAYMRSSTSTVSGM